MNGDATQVTVLLARQRSGTHALKSVLETHPAIYASAEIFHPSPRRPSAQEVNYFRFAERHASADREEVFLDYLAFVGELAGKPHVVLDVKYQHMDAALDRERLVELIRERKLSVLNLTRRNYVRYYLSREKAERQRRWFVDGDAPADAATDTPIDVDVDDLLRTLERCRAEDDAIAAEFNRHEPRLTLDYEDLVTGDTDDIAEPALARIAAWLGVPATFPQRKPAFRKQATLPLQASITNYPDVEQALRGTGFAYCLEDEGVTRNA